MGKQRESQWGDSNDLLLEMTNRPETSPERELLIAILLQAIEDLKTIRKMSVMHFFCSEHFNQIAKLLDYDSDAIRNRLVPTDVQKRLASIVYSMPAELLRGEGKPGRPLKHKDSYYLHSKQRKAQHQQPEESDFELFGLEVFNEVDTFSYVQPKPEPEPITYSHTFNSREVSSDVQQQL